MKTIQSKIVNALNEAIDNGQFVEPERVVGVNAPKQVHQCDDCACFYLVDEPKTESVCPECDGTGKPYGDIKECGVAGVKNTADPISSSEIIDESEEEELRSEADEIVTEALKYLDRSDFKKFNECYRPRVRMTKAGKLQAIVESKNGIPVTASRKMTSRQKASYKLAESYIASAPAITSRSSKRMEAIKVSRQELKIKNESRAVKLAACRLLERQGAKYNFRKFNEGMNKFINSRNYRKMLEDIAEDDLGKEELDKMTPDEIGDAVTTVVADTGLDIVSNDVDIDGETATVSVRVSDDDEQEVRTSEIESTLQDVFDAPVEIVGPNEAEGDATVKDIVVTVNPDDSVNENEDDDDFSDLGEGFDEDGVPNGLTETDPSPFGADTQIQEDDEPVRNPENGRKFESYRRRSARNRRFLKESKRMSLFALKLNESTDEDPKFLANDDSIVEGDDEDAEEKARLFVSEEAADKFLEDAGLEDEFTPKSVSVTEESLENEDDVTGEITEEGAEEVIETDDGKYFKKNECFYKESIDDGSVEEIDEDEYEDAKAIADADELRESYRRRRSKKNK